VHGAFVAQDGRAEASVGIAALNKHTSGSNMRCKNRIVLETPMIFYLLALDMMFSPCGSAPTTGREI
jgi:hypothetical protein